jgi:hypothetical protein
MLNSEYVGYGQTKTAKFLKPSNSMPQGDKSNYTDKQKLKWHTSKPAT